MVRVAVAGGARGIGLDIVQAILDTKKHELTVLSRTDQPLLTSKGIDVRVVDYSSVQQLKDALAGAHTVISCLAAYGSDTAAAELALLEAAKQAGTARFVPSEWNSACNDVVDLYSGKETVWKTVQSSRLEYTRFTNGLWMNVWGPGCLRDEEEALGPYKCRPPFCIDVGAGTALIPGDGSQRIVVTRTQDVGRFVAAALELPRWEAESRIAGDIVTFNEVVQLVKGICGKDLNITMLSVKDLEGILNGDNLDVGERFYYQLLLSIALGRTDFEPTLNSFCPHVKPLSVADYFRRHWKSD
ncbi:hypothetical protein Plec18167_000251 [Paecilomyces lecythidis]|uniref:NmrA-like domain-containing protein n=1 Tax=Paecilomyces lecythidis TaxID=3004212 RepID=A0ABR3YDD4_9EURO